ncbi:MAG: ABC transporter permease [Clostridia bacterium]|nr:ABC transporter permease [Clostridia bacterium]
MDKRLLTVIKKELKRIFTDRRLIFTTMILPAVSIFVMYSLMGNMIDTRTSDVEAYVGNMIVVNAPESFLNYAEEAAFTNVIHIKTGSASEINGYKDEIINGDLELLMIFDENFDSKVENYEQPNIQRYYNDVEDYSYEARYKIDNFLTTYEENLLGERIGSLSAVNVFDLNRGVEMDALKDNQKAAGKGLSILFPMLIAIFLFSGAMSVGPDMIAGEKERGTMATLLVTPVKRETLAMGKVIALAVVAVVSSLSSFIGIIASMPSAGSMFAEDGVNMAALQFGVKEYAYLALIMVTLVSLYVSVVCMVSIMSKSIKEANTYMAPIYMLVMVSGFTTMFADGSVPIYRMLIPVYGSVIALKNLFAFELTTKMVLYTCGSSIFFAALMVYGIKILFNNEKVMFSK